MKKILPFFSYIFHPLLIPLFACFYYFTYDDSFLASGQKFLVLAQFAIITFLIPVAIYFLLRSIGKIDSVMVEKVSQRKLPLALQAALVYILAHNTVTLEALPELYFFLLSVILSIIISFAFLFLEIKVSLHQMGTAGLLFFLVGLSIHNQVNIINTIAFWLVANGFTATSRLYMKAHTPREIAAGFLAGMLPQVVLWYFWL
ncbi:MAG: hypothetical protein EOO51_04895 [Flavobacterium sp.]|nr:MAG: hypothetical protein EOO51_04895 [Flavobacterium sp.]